MEPNYLKLKEIIDNDINKKVPSVSNESIIQNMYPVSKKLFSFFEQQNSYDTAATMLELKQWQQFKGDDSKPWRYEIRDIVLVNLGGTNYGYEASFSHPCIIYKEMFNEAMVIPCSTGRYKVKSDYIIKGESTDGFIYKTGIQLDKIRVISKKRIQGKRLGKVGNIKFNEITNTIIDLYFNPVKKRIEKLEENISDITLNNLELASRIFELEDELQSLKKELTEDKLRDTI
ncbi:type II toxin-antitoxin system PemK/MazF family toxin [Paenibacillus sp. 19GGS1-52]|uniref:type II toxin-antitoxin system PemK/MazF family toxin n=1 Tax=Paenibacillus sp. 19GGS1-52 TaxID=2758563 RepID=UPI001EFBFC19|nr:type II toxin-antitoxin system PemK/MazF family toxin [Paenibacillus sp. 19GGS1-52]ULO09656.1 type II toxin-antitoxin system PemK/MazF family toxin [Paenibacillus sp. 19GGS1-52]